MDHTPLINSFAYLTVSSRQALMTSLARIDQLLAMTNRASTDDGELWALIEYQWESSSKNRGTWTWYAEARRLSGNPVQRMG